MRGAGIGPALLCGTRPAEAPSQTPRGVPNDCAKRTGVLLKRSQAVLVMRSTSLR